MALDDFQERIAAGDIPEDVAEITSGCKTLLRVNSRVSQTIAVCIAAVYERRDLKEWCRWCREELGLESVSYRSHLAKVGKLLLSLTKRESDMPHYARLFECDVMKLLTLSRLPESQVLSFLSHNPDFERCSREVLRRRVAEWLGEEVAADSSQPELPGFEAALAAAAQLPAESFADAVRTPEHAEQALYSGLGFLAAALEFEKRREIPDVARLTEIKQALQSEISEIEEAIAKVL